MKASETQGYASMGMDQKVVCTKEEVPSWQMLAGLLAERHFPVQLRMIDGELAFPDESPPENWQELRVGTPHGMVTLRRETDGITLITWGNADALMRQSWNALAWALAHLAGGTVQQMSAKDFLHKAELPDQLRS